MLKLWFCKAYAFTLKKLFDEKTDPLVMVFDFFLGSECKYCMVTRASMVGLGVGLWSWVGVGLVVVAFLFTLGERYWLCDELLDPDQTKR